MCFAVPAIKFHFIFYCFSSNFKNKNWHNTIIYLYICRYIRPSTTSHHWRHCSNVVPMSQGSPREHWLQCTSLGQCSNYSDARCNASCNSARHRSIPPQAQTAPAAPACEYSVTQLLQSSVRVSSTECKLTKVPHAGLPNRHSKYRSSALIECPD
jgi:hypothetical protein